MEMHGKELEIYIHIPFCVRKCAYCDFLSFPAGKDTRERYVDALIREITEGLPGESADAGEKENLLKVEDYHVVSIFFGGGTPSLLEGEASTRILQTLRNTFRVDEDAEITIECNPGTVDAKKLGDYRNAGINRLSFGLQSASNEELILLGRIHTYEEFLHSWQMAKEAGFTNISVDLMSGLPGQSAESWHQTLTKVLKLRPAHISAYSLIIEEGTPFYERYHADDELRQDGGVPHLLPDEEAERAMYEDTAALLKENGLERYEISNYAIPGYESRHNTGYWIRREYVGFGLGASSLLGNRRLKNTDDLSFYLKMAESSHIKGLWEREVQTLSREDEMSETMFLGLRLVRGVDKMCFAQRFGMSVEEAFPGVLEKMCRQGLMKEEEGYLRLTERGLDVANYVMSEFL